MPVYKGDLSSLILVVYCGAWSLNIVPRIVPCHQESMQDDISV